MGFIWTKIHSSPPQQRRNEVREICNRHGGRLCNNEIYYGEGDDEAFALIEVPADAGKRQELIDDLQPIELHGLVDAEEKERGEKPPG